MKAFRLVFALVALAVASACTADSMPGPTAPSYNSGMDSPGKCNDPAICP